MTSKPEPAVHSWEVMLTFFLITAFLVLFGKLFWEPTNNAVKRIESMKPCATSSGEK